MSLSVRSRRTEYESMSRGDLIALLCDRDRALVSADSPLGRDVRARQDELESQNARLRAERDALDAARSLFADLFERAPLPYCVFDRNGVVENANESAAALLRIDRDALVGAPFTRAVNVLARQTFFDHISRCVDERVRVTSELEVEVRSRGRLVLRAASTPVVRPPMHVARSCRTVLDDVTRRKREQAALRLLADADERLAAAADARAALDAIASSCVPALGDACFVDLVDGDGASLKRVEIAARGAREIAEILQQHASDPGWRLYQAQIVQTLTPVFEPATAAALGAPYEARLGARGLLIVPLTSRGETLGTLGLVLTTAERAYSLDDFEMARDFARRAARALAPALAHDRARAALRGHDAVVSAVSHDLRALAGEIATRSQVGDAALVQRAVVRLERVARDLCEVTDLDATSVSSASRATDLGALASEVIAKLAPTAHERAVAIESHFGDRLVAGCEPRLMGRVLETLLEAAVDVTPGGGTVHARVERLGNVIRVAVADSGPAVASEALEHAFDPSWPARVEDCARARTGLGLYVARVIVEAHGGTIGAVPRDDGVTFFFILRARDPAPPSDEVLGAP